MKFASTRRFYESGLVKLFVGRSQVLLCRYRHRLCALSSESLPCLPKLGGFSQIPPEDPLIPTVDLANSRVPWELRLNGAMLQKWSTRTRTPFSTQRDAYMCYLPHVRELLKGLWLLDKSSIWLLVDDLVATGEPNGTPDTCPEYSQWRHVVASPYFSDAISTLVAQGHLRYHSPMEDLDKQNQQSEESEEDSEENDAHAAIASSAGAVPTWLVAFILATLTNTREAAYEGLAFCISQLDTTPRRFRASLLLISMCSLSAHGAAVHVPVLLDAFHDIFFYNQVIDNPERNTGNSQSLGSQETVIYQHNALLLLLAHFPHVPGFAQRTIRFLHQMEASQVSLETDTAKQLIAARFASEPLVRTVHDIVERQSALDPPEQFDDVSAALLRFYSKRSNQTKVSQFADASRRAHLGHHAKAYLRSFRDTAASLASLRTIEAGQDGNLKHVPVPSHGQDKHHNAKDHDAFVPVQDRAVRLPSTTAGSLGVPKRHIYTSLLYSAALSQAISAPTFRDLFTTIRQAHGDDRVLETVALSGMLKRQAWDGAKDIWREWQMTNRSIQSLLREMRTFVQKRQWVFGDAGKVRRTLGWTKLTEFVTLRRMKMLKVDASALAVIVRALAGPKPDSLPDAFMTMDRYALKWRKEPCPGRSGFEASNPQYPSPCARDGPNDEHCEQIQLTSCVINCFMVRAMYFRRPDVVFRLWDGMTSHYGVDSSVATLGILLRSARLAASMETAISKLIPRWMTSSRGIFRGRIEFPDLSAEILWMLGPDCSPDMRWDGVPPWRLARHIFREDILFANWPWLRYVQVPAQAVRGDEATGRIEAFRELTMDKGLWGTNIRKMGKYPHLFPSPRTFREYIVMLGMVQRSSEIPEVLAWMKALEVRPSRQLLGISLALWSQVGLDSLVDDVWGEAKLKPSCKNQEGSAFPGQQKHGGEYAKLVTWLGDWVGKKNVPGESEVLESFRYLQELERKETILY